MTEQYQILEATWNKDSKNRREPNNERIEKYISIYNRAYKVSLIFLETGVNIQAIYFTSTECTLPL